MDYTDTFVMNRDEAWGLLNEYTESESLLKHALCVEAAMRHYATRRGKDTEQWGVTGLIWLGIFSPIIAIVLALGYQARRRARSG